MLWPRSRIVQAYLEWRQQQLAHGPACKVFCNTGLREASVSKCNTARHNRWQLGKKCHCLQPRGGAGLVAHKDKLFVIGGFSGKEQGDVHIFDMITQTWQELTGGPALPARSVFALGVLPQSDNKMNNDVSRWWIVVFGGEVDPSDLGHEGAGDYADEVFGLDPDAPQLGWHKLSIKGTAPSPRAWLASTSFASGMALHGGNAPDNSRLDDLYMLGH